MANTALPEFLERGKKSERKIILSNFHPRGPSHIFGQHDFAKRSNLASPGTPARCGILRWDAGVLHLMKATKFTTATCVFYLQPREDETRKPHGES